MREETYAERVADGVIHILGIAFGAAATTAFIMVLWAANDFARQLSIYIYVGTLLAMLICSATYNILEKDNKIGILRRLDHSAIYFLIAGTYTPLCLMVLGGWLGTLMLVGIWICAIAGAAIKILHINKMAKLAVPIYLAMGWVSFFAIVPIYNELSISGFTLLATGGGLYTVGTLFYIWKSLPFQNAIWHGFVLSAAACHFAMIMVDVALPGLV